jgi:hypothetical protein
MTHILAYQSPGGEKEALESVQVKRMGLTVRICVSALIEKRGIDQGKKPL